MTHPPSSGVAPRHPRRVVAVVPDLFFATRIATTARALGVELEACAASEALAACRRDPPDLVIVDLQAAGDPVALAVELKRDPGTRAIPVAGFYAHVDQETRRAAEAGGVDVVLPRSAFTARLAELLAGAAPPRGG